jgi:hypothetical protein
MDRVKPKKIRNIRVIATNLFMCLSVVVIVFILMMIAMGFTFSESGKLEQAGLAQLVSYPSDASVTIDGESQFGHTEFSKMLSSGTHQIAITKSGYDTWSKDLNVDAGLLTRVEWIRLFPKKAQQIDSHSFDDLRLAVFSSNRKKLLAIEKGSNTLQYIDIQGDKLKIDKLNLNDCLSTTAAKAVNGTLSVIAWNNNSSRVIIKWVLDDKTSWHLIDLEHSDASINLTKRLNLDFESILIANDSASKLWALENGNLRLIDANNLTISGSFASNIEKIAHNRDTVAFINVEDGVRQLNTYKDGEKGSTVIKKLENTDDKTVIKLAMGSYWNEDWLAYSVNKQIFILGGKYPSYGKNDVSKLKTKLERELDYTPQLLSVNANQRIAVFSGDNKMTSYDIETKDYFDTELTVPLTNITWIDSYLLWQNVDNAIVVRDFDGNNRRKVASNVNNPFPAIISENNRWLYYFDIVEEETKTDANAEAPSDADPVTATETKIKYTLKRKSLQ